MPLIQLAHPPRTRDELWWVVRALFGINIPRTKVCPDHCAPFDAFADAYFRVCTVLDGQPLDKPRPISRALWHGSRGLSGKSMSLSILGMTFAYIDGADITILGGSMSQSANVHEYCTKAMESENLPVDMTRDQTATKILLTNAARLRPLPASQRTVRGPHPSALLIDEVDEMELSVYDAALGQPMPQKNYLKQIVHAITVISSTWQNPDGTLTEIFRRCEQDGTPIYRWCYRETSNPVDGWCAPETVEDKRTGVSAEMWRTEYELGEPAIGNRAFDGDAVEAAFCLKFKPEDPIGEGEGYVQFRERRDLEEYRFEGWQQGGVYVAGADWAKEQDKTVIWVARVDGPKRRLVFYQRVNRRPYPVMISAFNKELRRYRIPRNGAWHDSTGLGDVVDDYVDTRAKPFQMTGEKRAKMLSNYVNAVEKGAWELPRIPSAYGEMKYCRIGDLYAPAPDVAPVGGRDSNRRYHLPDTVCAAALAEHAARRVVVPVAPQVVERSGALGQIGEGFSVPEDDDERGGGRSLADLGRRNSDGISLVVG